MTDRASSPSRTLTPIVGSCLVLAMVAAACGVGTRSQEAADEPRSSSSTVTTTWGRERLAAPGDEPSTSSSASPSPPTTAKITAPPAAPSPPTTVAPAPRAPAGDDTTVERVTDGDTIVVAGGRRVRLIGMNTPETKDPSTSVECFGPEASGRMRELLPVGTPVRLVYDVDRTDQYDRTLAYVYRLSDGLFVNLALVRDGFAQTATYPPNVAHVDEIRAAETEARTANRGLWAGCPTGGTSATTAPPAPSTVAPTPTPGGGTCDASYPDVCIPPGPPDLDCGEITHKRFRVVGADPHGFDGNKDGVGCES